MSDSFVRGYLTANVRHLLPWDTSLNDYAIALCGVAPSWPNGPWHGSGSQEEIETLEVLRDCGRCTAIANSARRLNKALFGEERLAREERRLEQMTESAGAVR